MIFDANDDGVFDASVTPFVLLSFFVAPN